MAAQSCLRDLLPPCATPSATSACPTQAKENLASQTAEQYTLTTTVVAPYQYHFTGTKLN